MDENIETFTKWVDSFSKHLREWEWNVERDEALREVDDSIPFMDKWNYEYKTQLEMIPAQVKSAISRAIHGKVDGLQPDDDLEKKTIEVALLATRIWGGDNFVFLDLNHQFKSKQSPQIVRNIFQKCVLLIVSNLDEIEYLKNEEMINQSLKPEPFKGPNHDRDKFMYDLAKKGTKWRTIRDETNSEFVEFLDSASSVQKAVNRFIEKMGLPTLEPRKKKS